MLNKVPKITVFTPVFNRSDTLHRVWNSLQNQTFKDFEWIIIDDGSTNDNPEDLINSYIKDASFDVTFIKFKINRGKHNAINKAVDLAKGEFFIIADSDDEFKANAFDLFLNIWNSIDENQINKFCGVRACCQDQFGKRISDTLPNDPMDMTMSEAYYIHNFRKESWCMILTKVHREFTFPVNHKGYFPEGIIWKAMTRKYILRFTNQVNRIYYIDSVNSIMSEVKNPKDKIDRNLASSLDILNNDIGFFFKFSSHFYRNAILCSYYSIYANNIWGNYSKINQKGSKALFILSIPLAYGLYILRLLNIKK